MAATHQLRLDVAKRPAHPFLYRPPKRQVLTISGPTADMRKAQKVESLWLPLAVLLSEVGREFSKLYNPRFLRMKLQSKLLQTMLQFEPESFGVRFLLEPNDKSSSPGEFHPQALTEPDVNVSAHPALIVQSQGESLSASVQTAADHVGQFYQTNEPHVACGDGVVCICGVPSKRVIAPDIAIPG